MSQWDRYAKTLIDSVKQKCPDNGSEGLLAFSAQKAFAKLTP
jgi:hypothetical protein